MTHELLIAGFGGQGVLSMGMTLGYAGMIENKEVTWMPSYGPEMRGGTANCIVIVSDKPISSPIVSTFDTVIVLNQPSMDKFETRGEAGRTAPVRCDEHHQTAEANGCAGPSDSGQRRSGEAEEHQGPEYDRAGRIPGAATWLRWRRF